MDRRLKGRFASYDQRSTPPQAAVMASARGGREARGNTPRRNAARRDALAAALHGDFQSCRPAHRDPRVAAITDPTCCTPGLNWELAAPSATFP